MRKAHPFAADVIQSVFCLAMTAAEWHAYESDRSHTWSRYWWVAVAVVWATWCLSAFDRLWKRFREGPTS